MKMPTTPSQTVGPFFGFGMSWPGGPYVVPEGTDEAFWVRGRVFDGAGDPVPDALVETWQADCDGRFAHPDDPRGAVEWTEFRGFGRCPTDGEGRFGILTRKPGRVPDARLRPQAPHLAVSVLARGLLDRVITRIYFADEPEANAADPVLSSLPEDAQRATLLASVDGNGYRFDIRLQGDHETVFFEI
jgi:protocatechuate 3,4-dioxygenase, alpha subunit